MQSSEFEEITGIGQYTWSSHGPVYCHTYRGFQIASLGERWIWFEGGGCFGTAASLEQAYERIDAARARTKISESRTE